MRDFFFGGTCAGGGDTGASFGVGARGGGLGLEGAGGGGGDEEVEGAVGGLADDACSFASRFIRIWNASQRLSTMVMRGDATRTRSASLVGSVNGWLELMVVTVS